MAAKEPAADLAWIEVKSCLLLLAKSSLAWIEVKSCLLLLAKSSLAPSLKLNYVIFEGSNISVIESLKLFMILISLLTICSPIILDAQKGSDSFPCYDYCHCVFESPCFHYLIPCFHYLILIVVQKYSCILIKNLCF